MSSLPSPENEKDIEAGVSKPLPTPTPVTQSLYSGQGTPDNPFVIEFAPNDPKNPKNWSSARKWAITAIGTLSVLAVTLTSSAYSAAHNQMVADLHMNDEEFAAGLSLYVLGFAVGPPLWAPLSELYGRRICFNVSLGLIAVFTSATAGAQTITQVLIFRFICGSAAAAPLTIVGGIVSDIFTAEERGVGIAYYSAAPFLGPILGPLLGGFITINVGWRWVQGVCAIFVGVNWIAGLFLVSETYTPVILQGMANNLAKKDGKSYTTIINQNSGAVSGMAVFNKTLKRPWVLLFREPIVLITAIYLAIIYATIYSFIPAFPIVYEELRGWNAGIGGLAYLGIAVGMVVGLIFSIYDNKRYARLGDKATPESRLPACLVGAIALPVGLFGFAWTNAPSIHWSASIILSSFFGFGSVIVWLPITNYLVDIYTIYTASVLAATAMFRALIGSTFPLFTTQMYQNLGIHWASSIPGFLTLACMPFPFIMYKYGAKIRMRCKYAAQAALQFG
ncbi:MFS transporter [Xylariaceae sp. FL0255]|nr:MFS transporter [Xylariaceae sp. FL0255]